MLADFWSARKIKKCGPRSRLGWLIHGSFQLTLDVHPDFTVRTASSRGPLTRACGVESSDDCENVELQRVLPPGGDWSAVTFARSCGATTRFSTQGSVIAEGSMPLAGGNVFSVDTLHGSAPAGSLGGSVVRVALRGVDALIVRHHPKARVFVFENQAHGIRVHFVKDSLP